MANLNIEILNPKARKLLKGLADLKLISIQQDDDLRRCRSIVRKARAKNSASKPSEIAKEVKNDEGEVLQKKSLTG